MRAPLAVQTETRRGGEMAPPNAGSDEEGEIHAVPEP